MEKAVLRSKLIGLCSHIAPEIDEIEVDDELDLQEQLDLDSVDMMNYIIKIEKEFKSEIPSQEYRTFSTLKGAIHYLSKEVP